MEIKHFKQIHNQYMSLLLDFIWLVPWIMLWTVFSFMQLLFFFFFERAPRFFFKSLKEIQKFLYPTNLEQTFAFTE